MSIDNIVKKENLDLKDLSFDECKEKLHSVKDVGSRKIIFKRMIFIVEDCNQVLFLAAELPDDDLGKLFIDDVDIESISLCVSNLWFDICNVSKDNSYINNQALNAYLKLHNIQKDCSMIYLKNEYLFSKYYTLSGKKHYALKVIWQEGKDVEFTDIKGLEMKRSEIPSYSQKLLTNILDVILSDQDNILDIILKMVEEAKLEAIKLIEQRDNSIVRVVSFSKKMKNYKKLPQHIKAMQIWNIMAGKEDFKQYSKGKMWPIMGFKMDKAPEHIRKNYSEVFLKKFKSSDFNVICLTEDVQKLPEWAEPNVKDIISYAIDDRVGNLIEPLAKPAQMLLF